MGASLLLETLRGQEPGAVGADVPPLCIQCGTCSAVCPLIEYMDDSPRLINAMLQAGRRDEVLRSRAIWVCTSCYACTVACPKQFPLTESIYALKRASMRGGLYPRRFATPVMAAQFVHLVGRRGRSSESWISAMLYLRTRPGQLLRYTPLAVRLLRRGRLRLRRESLREPGQLRRMLDALGPSAGEPA